MVFTFLEHLSQAMPKLKIYFETTLFNYYFDTDREAHADTVRLFKEIAAGKYEAFTSTVVLDELAKAPAAKYAAMSALVRQYQIKMLLPNPDAEKLADLYLAEKIVPKKYRNDGLHIALSTVNHLDIIASLNFNHIVKLKVLQMTGFINATQGYRPVAIVSPKELVSK